MDWIWSWHLHEPSPGRTRLVQRNRMRLEPAWFERAFLATIVPADFVMARSHLRGLQRRTEAPAQPTVPEPAKPRAYEGDAPPGSAQTALGTAVSRRVR
jgi:hypothetical protein